MAVLLFPDNTVLINFAIIDRMDLLERLANGNGRWCATVARECDRSARESNLGALAQARGIFGSPLAPDAAEHQDARRLREELASPGDHPHQHLGEAETLAIMTRRHLQGFFVTDDQSAVRLAAREGIPTVGTWHLLKVANKVEFLDAETLWGHTQTLRAKRRGGPPAVGTSRSSFDKWLTG